MSMRDCLDCEYYSEYTQECSLNELPESCIESERRTMSRDRDECASCGDIIEDSPQPYCKTCWKDFYEKNEREQ